MKKYSVLIVVLFLTAVGLLLNMAPDRLSKLFLGIMIIILTLGFVSGILPTILLADGFRNARKSIADAQEIQSDETWLALFNIDDIFGHKLLNNTFYEYKNAVQAQRETGGFFSDIEDYINEEFLTLHTWRGLNIQIPGTLTGLGILGTFIGLLTGIGSIEFSTVDAALESISTLLDGIEVAFYTSIAGVILSILFNIISHLLWNVLLREYGLFIEDYHRRIIPSVEVQKRQKMNDDIREIILRLDRIPRRAGFSLAQSAGEDRSSSGNAQILMPQIVQGLENGEFTFYLQPSVELGTRKILRAEALVRWNHEMLGLLTPATFLPVVEKNGFITKLDMYIWDLVCSTIRDWIDAGKRPVPISINLSRTDIMAMDTVEFFDGLLKKYHIPPRTLELEISQNAYAENMAMFSETAGALRRMGFKVVMDGFDGDFISVNMLKGLEIDGLKLDLRQVNVDEFHPVDDIFDQARKLGIELSVEGIETMEQITMLKNAGCTEGQGYYYFSPVSLSEYEDILGNV